jgi:hypothetical protein
VRGELRNVMEESWLSIVLILESQSSQDSFLNPGVTMFILR